MTRSGASFSIFLLACVSWVFVSRANADLPPNALLGKCLDDDWVKSVEAKLKINHNDRDAQGRLVHPFLHPALRHQLFSVDDSRTAAKTAYSSSCVPAGATIHRAGATVDLKTGVVSEPGTVNGSLILELSGWTSHSLATLVFSILAAEVYGYKVSHYYVTDTLALTERMSSVRSGQCTPTHLNVEVWIAGIEATLQVYSNESYPAGAIGYFGRSGLYTTSAFVNTSMTASPPLFADFWKGYRYNEDLITAMPTMDTLKANTAVYPPTEVTCAAGSFACVGTTSCSKSRACHAREAAGGKCMVVAMMYDYYDPGYLQAVMTNIKIPAYFCFIGYGGVQDFALKAAQDGKPVLFYHYEPELFHLTNPGAFQRVFLPRSVPERVVLATGLFGDIDSSDNPVDVDFPTTKLTKYAASFLQSTLPIGQLISKFTLQELDINDLLRKYLTASNDATEPDPTFRAACQWVRENYAVWSLWMDRLPICTFDTHIRYDVFGCNGTERVITFHWTHPNPDDAKLAYNCDGGTTSLPAPLYTSRSCEWIAANTAKWRDWNQAKPECDASFYKYNVTDCDSGAKRLVKYWWLLPDPKDATKSYECLGGASLPDDVSVECEYMPTSAPAFFVITVLAGIFIIVLVAAIVFVFVQRSKPIVKRSQYELLILMIIGGILVCIASVLYAGKPTHALCGGRPLTISLGFTTIFGSLFVKSLRVYRVFMRSAMKRVTVTMTMMFKVFGVFLSVDVLIIAVWFIVDFPSPTTTTTSAIEFRGDIDIVTCKSTSFLFTAVLMFWKAMVLLSGLYLSFLIRNVSADFQESIWIFGSSLIVLIACMVVLPLAYLVKMAASIFYVFLAAAFLLSTAVVMGMMLVPKLLRLNEVAKSSRYTETGATQSGQHLLQRASAGSTSVLVAAPRPRVGSATTHVQPMTTMGDTDTEVTRA